MSRGRRSPSRWNPGRVSGLREDVRYRFNFTVNVLDGGFFGFALGAASFVAVIPLFVHHLTDSAILIGLIPAIHDVGWQLPQLFTSRRVTRLSRYKPMVLWATIHERLPFLGLALVAWYAEGMDRTGVLILTYSLLVWQGLGGGITGTAWQSMIGKIIPPRRHGLFYGVQAAAAHFLYSLGSVLAGVLLARLAFPRHFAALFLIAGLAMGISFVFLALTREEHWPSPPADRGGERFWPDVLAVLRGNRSFRWFVLARAFAQFGVMAVAFYSVYAVRNLEMNEATAGWMAAVFAGIQIVANPVLGWLGDRRGYRFAMLVGLCASVLSALVALAAPTVAWFYLAFALAGVANVAVWTIMLAMVLSFGAVEERPTYIGLANTLVAPVTLLAPMVGGWLADTYGYQTAFLAAAFGGILSLSLFWSRVPGGRAE